MMGNSLQSQLLKMGLVDEKKLKQAKKEKHKKAKQKQGKNNRVAADGAKRLAQQAMAGKAERDRELNRQRKEDAECKALAAQIKQIIEANRVPKDDGDVPYNFVDGNKVKRIYVTEEVQRRLSLGRLAIVRLEGWHELVPVEVAEKIRERAPDYVLEGKESEQPGDEDDPYADYKVPDDLMW